MNKSILVTAALMLAVGLGLGVWLSPSPSPSSVSGDMDSHIAKDEIEEAPLFYRNPMDPTITSPIPAQDSMGMDYIPVYADNSISADKVGTVKIDATVIQNTGVRTHKVKRTSMSRTIKAVGRVDFNEESMVRLHPKVEGWIESLQVDKTGEVVNKNDILLSIYSPKLVSTQQEYLLALSNMNTLKDSPFDEIKQGAEDLVNSSLERLYMLDVPSHQIKELEKTLKVKKNLHIHSPVSGTIINIGSREGQYVTPKTELYMIVDLSQVWVYANVYEYELPWVKVGDEVNMTLSSVPGKTFTGSLAYIYPYAESKTRTTKVRIIFDNQDLLLRPNMFADVEIYSDKQENAIVIPSESVIRSGENPQVFVVRAPGKFEPRLVVLGIESEGQVTVLSGLEAGEEVVTSSQFLVDSESKLSEATAKMMESLNDEKSEEVESDKAIDHSSMNMGSNKTDSSNHEDHSGMEH